MSFKTGADNKVGKSGDTSSPSIISLLDKIRVVKENLSIRVVNQWTKEPSETTEKERFLTT